jgi:hypothetical protein
MARKMWHILNSNSGAVQAICAVAVTFLTVVLAGATLRYVRLTKQIAAASVTQAEAAHKPVLTLKHQELTNEEIVAHLTSGGLVGEKHAWVGSALEIINIGTGPALHVKWTLSRFSDTNGTIPYIMVGQFVSLRTASKVKMAAVPTTYELVCRYTSLSGTKYVSRTGITNSREISSFEIKTESDAVVS